MAEGSLYFDDGIDIVQEATKEVKLKFLLRRGFCLSGDVMLTFHPFSRRTRIIPFTLVQRRV